MSAAKGWEVRWEAGRILMKKGMKDQSIPSLTSIIGDKLKTSNNTE